MSSMESTQNSGFIEVIDVRSTLLEAEVKTWLSKQWLSPEKTELSDKWGVSLLTEPFKVCTLTDLIPDFKYLNKLKNELLTLQFHVKNNDLYQYRQSHDLYNFDSPAINSFKFLLEHTVRPWLQDVTNIELGEKISTTCSCYDDTDYLLCHDDQCEDRCIAYIFYLNQNWTSDDGGALQLFNTEVSDPGIVVQSILPQFNALIFFEVSETSFHQVQEVLTMDRTRITINGWFHGPRKIKPHLPSSQSYTLVSMPLLQTKKDISSLLGYMYCEHDELMKMLNSCFEMKSSILLEDFLFKDFYQECSKALTNTSVSWIRKGPVNRQLYEVAVEETLDPQLQTLLEFMKSEQLFQLLTKLTCLELTSDLQKTEAHERTVKVTNFSYEIRKWKAGYYSLLTDDRFSKEGLLDVTLFFNAEMDNDYGGSSVYITRGRSKDLLTVSPHSNALSVVYREKDVANFVKYINHQFSGNFFTINLSCAEQS